MRCPACPYLEACPVQRWHRQPEPRGRAVRRRVPSWVPRLRSTHARLARLASRAGAGCCIFGAQVRSCAKALRGRVPSLQEGSRGSQQQRRGQLLLQCQSRVVCGIPVRAGPPQFSCGAARRRRQSARRHSARPRQRDRCLTARVSIVVSCLLSHGIRLRVRNFIHIDKRSCLPRMDHGLLSLVRRTVAWRRNRPGRALDRSLCSV